MRLLENDILRIKKSASRLAEIDSGMRIPTHKIHKNKKLYTRKNKHKIRY